jgi:hypothetical protein
MDFIMKKEGRAIKSLKVWGLDTYLDFPDI